MTDGPILIGLTGSIGMGKSTTAALFADLGVQIWDADAAVGRLYGAGGAAVGPLGELVPEAVSDTGLDRAKLREAISKDASLLPRIEEIVHPLVRADRQAFTREHASAEFLLFDIPLLFETGSEAEFDAVVVVTASAELQRERVLARQTMDEAAFELILSKQMPDVEKRARADFIVETLTLDAARKAVQTVLEELRGRRDA